MRYVVVGGGIAGVSCALGLIREDRSPDSKVVLISASSHVKMVTNWHKVGQFTEQFDVQETEVSLTEDPRFELLNAIVSKWDSKKQELETTVGRIIKYDKLCIATGARPKCPWKNDRVLTIRDMDTALTLQEKLADAKNVVIVGNGGIATELVYELNNVNVTWLIRDSSISSSFFPAEAENFLLPRLKTGRTSGSKNSGILKRPEFSASPSKNQSKISGAALGPDWCTAIQLSSSEQNLGHNVDVVNNCEVFDVKFNEEVLISYEKRGKSFEVSCDVLIWATGVEPNSDLWKRDCKKLELSSEGGIIVDDMMKTNYPNVYACGDVCSVKVEEKLWKQMRLWTQARQTGDFCSHSMTSQEDATQFNIFLELFAHCTTFFGHKVVLLGDYKPERQEKGSWRIVERIVDDEQYVRCVVVEHKVVGAMLIGETDLEETMENLILNKTNIAHVEEVFLDPDVDIDDYFD